LQIRETLALIKELGNRHTVLLSTHILSEVETICERVIIIANGRVGLSQRLDEIESENVILLEARGPEDQITHTLKHITGIVSVQPKPIEDGLVSFEIRTGDNQDVREEVSGALSGKGWPIRRLERKTRRLEDAFFDVLRAQDPLKQPMPDQTVPTEPAPGSSGASTPETEAIMKKD
jgi:ABC-2 type transport system ATP-binding protein